jgi:hypothetical protein
MASRLIWSALLLAALAAVAYCNPEDKAVCDAGRPVIGTGACCKRHRVAGLAAIATVAEFEAARRAEVNTLDPPWIGAGRTHTR